LRIRLATLSIFTQSGEWVIISSKIKWYQTIKFKLFVVFFIVGVVPILVFSIYTSSALNGYFKEINEKEALYQANKVAGSIKKAGYLSSPHVNKQMWDELLEKANENNYRIIVVDSNALVVADTNDTAVDKVYIVPEILTALGGQDVANLRLDRRGNTGVIYSSAYIEDAASNKIGAVLIVSPYDDALDTLGALNTKWMYITIGLLVVVGALVLMMSQVILSPIRSVLDTIQKIAAGQLHQRLDVRGHNEFSQLSDAVNNMTTRLEQVESSRQEFVSNVSHELKTPLSSIKVLTESILLQENVPSEVYREFLEDINSEIDRMTAIVNDLLSLVKLDYNGAKLNIAETDMNRLLRDIIKRLKPLADNKNIDLSFEAAKEVNVDADEVKLSLAISNLVENGIKYTPMDGKVKVSVDADHQNCYITVQDTGIGISEQEQSKIFDRFYRVDKTRDRETGGTGLGLAITHSTVMLHNGTVQIISGEGEGATFIVSLPLKYQQG
jgi:signal transduction histidine kinase